MNNEPIPTIKRVYNAAGDFTVLQGDYVYNGVTGLTVRNIRDSADWVRRHRSDIWRVSVHETSGGAAYVDVQITDYVILREHWPNYSDAVKRYRRLNVDYGVKVFYHPYNEQ